MMLRSPVRRSRRSRGSRSGLSLFEVLIALGIFLIALTAIGPLLSTGSRAAVDARLEAEAALRAESMLHELLAGVQPLETTGATPCEGDPGWFWSAQVLDGPHVDLLLVVVTVFRQDDDETPYGAVSLTRLVRNPQLFLDAALEAQ